MSSDTTASASPATHMPPILWAQRQQHVYVTVPLQDATNVSVELQEDGAVLALSMTGADGVHYACALRLFAPVAAEESRHVVRPRQIEIKLRKKQRSGGGGGGGGAGHDGDDNDDDDAVWPRLTHEKNRHPQIQIDWHKWRDDDDDGGYADGADLDHFGMHTGGDDSDADGDGDGMQSELLSKFMQQRARLDAAEHADEDARKASQDAHGGGDAHHCTSQQLQQHTCHGHEGLHKEQRQRAADDVDNDDDDMPPLEDDADN